MLLLYLLLIPGIPLCLAEPITSGPGLWPLVTPVLNVSPQCLNASIQYINGLKNYEMWALQMLDSSGMLPFLQQGMLSDMKEITMDLCPFLKDTLNGRPCPEALSRITFSLPFGYGTGQGSQHGCATVPGEMKTKFCHNALMIDAISTVALDEEPVITPQTTPPWGNIDKRTVNRILNSIQSPTVKSNQFQIPTDLIDSQILIDIITNRHPTILLMAEKILGNITTTLQTSCPECRDISLKLDQIIMLWGLVWYSVNNMNGGGGFISFAAYRACYPAACTNDDIVSNSYTFGLNHSLTSGKNRTFLFSFLNSEEAIEEVGIDMFMGCTTDERYNGDWNVGNKIILTIFSLLLVFLIGGTLFDIHERITRQKENNATTFSIIRGFSVLKNFEFIFSTNPVGQDRLDCLEGMRAISMTWVVLGHSFLFSNKYMFVNNRLYSKAIEDGHDYGMAFMAVIEGPYSVDTFFLIGATLVSYLLIKDLDKTKGWTNPVGLIHMVVLYVNRFLRITVPYAFMIMFTIGITPLIIKEPLTATSYVQYVSSSCSQHWLNHLLYYNNFVKYSGLCIGQTWFLGTDMIFFLGAPLLIYPLWLAKRNIFYRIGAYILWLTSIILSLAWSFHCIIGVNYGKKWEDVCWTGIIENPDFAPWGRRNQCYIVGLFLGHILHETKGKKIKILPVVNMVIWQAVFLLLFALVYAPYETNLERGWSEPEQWFWYSCSHLLWGICLAWIVFACCRGHGGLVNDFLSWSGWSPIAKISFMTYLVHMDLMFIYFTMQDYNLDWTMLLNVKLFLGNLAAALTLGLVTSITWELPFAKLQKILIQRAVKAVSGR